MPFPLPCCYPDDRPCWEQWCEISEQVAAEQACRDSGGCPGTFGFTCEDWACEDFTPVSCCDLTDGQCHCGYAWNLCLAQLDGIVMCPDCSSGESCTESQQTLCDEMANGLHVCCYDMLPATGLCQVLTYAQCVALDGRFLWEQDECNEYVCGVGCREAELAEGHPTIGPQLGGPEWGQKRHTTDTCYPVALVVTNPPAEHNSGVPTACMALVTAHEVRNVARSTEDDPCALAYGVLGYDHRGILRPYLCSRVRHDDPKSVAYSEGFFCNSVPDENGECPLVPCGCIYGRVNVMAEPPREAQYHHPQLICAGIE